MITDGAPILTFGSLDLMGGDQSGPFWFAAAGDDADLGNPEAVTREITAFLMDGAISVTDRYGNRSMTLRVVVCGDDAYGLAQGEAALMDEVGGRNTLTWAPPNRITGFAAPCVFDVVNSSLAHNFDDLGDLNLQRIYTLTIEALPFARSSDAIESVSPAPAVTPLVTTSIDNCSATAGWSVTNSAVLTDAGSAMKAERTRGDVNFQNHVFTLKRTGMSVSMAGTPFLRLVYTTAASAGATFQRVDVLINGRLIPQVASNGSVHWYAPGITTLTSIELVVYGRMTVTGQKYSILLDDVSRSNSSADSAGGDRQTFRTLDVKGSCRTQGSLAIESASSSLGSVLVYTCPASTLLQQPPLRALRTDGSTGTADSTRISGRVSPLTTNHVFDIPAASVPAGGYLLVARMRVTSGTSWTLTWSGSSVINGTAVDPSPVSGTTPGTSATNVWTTVVLGKLPLPTYGMGSSGLVRIQLSGSANTQLDEAWIFNTDVGRLTMAELGTGSPAAGGSSSRLWLDAASADNPVPSVWCGFSDDRSDAHGIGTGLTSFGAHEFTPPATNVFVVTSDAIDTAVTLGPYFPRFHSHVVE